jgi:uncharacterized protein (DUF433 family)
MSGCAAVGFKANGEPTCFLDCASRTFAMPVNLEHDITVRMKESGKAQCVELGRYVVADPKICHGQPTYKGTRIMAWIVLEQIERGLTWEEIEGEWNGKVSGAAIAETMALSHLIRKGEPFRGFHAGNRRKPARQSTPVAA